MRLKGITQEITMDDEHDDITAGNSGGLGWWLSWSAVGAVCLLAIRGLIELISALGSWFGWW